MNRAKEQQRSRQRILWGFGIFMMIQFIAGVVIDYGYPLIRSRRMSELFAQVHEMRHSPSTLFLGSSRSQAAIDDQMLDDSFNAAVPSGDALICDHLLEELLRAGVRPRRLVLEASPEFFNSWNACYEYNAIRLLRWEHLPEHLIGVIYSNQAGRLVLSRFLPLLVHREHLWALAHQWGTTGKTRSALRVQPRTFPSKELCFSRGSSVSPIVPELTPALRHLMENGAQDVRRRWMVDYRISPAEQRALARVVKRCEREGIELIVLIPPVTSFQRATYDDAIKRPFLQMLEVETSRQVTRIDAWDWLPDAAFVDSHHANRLGSLLFTQRLRQVLNRRDSAVNSPKEEP